MFFIGRIDYNLTIIPGSFMEKKAFITGITGQDGSYLAEFLLAKGYEVYGLVRRVALEDEHHRMQRILAIRESLHLLPGSLESYPSVYKCIQEVMPDEIYHLAAQSYVTYSFDDEFSTLNTNINGTHYVLSACRELVPDARIYFAASSEMFGRVRKTPQNEETPFHPRSSYGISKVAGFELTRNYRESYDMFACSGILFNHESPRRGFEFVTRKITSHAAMIKLGLTDKIPLGNIEAKRDWGHAKEYVKVMWMMLQNDTPEDYVVATGKCHSVRKFLEMAFASLDLDYHRYLEIDEALFRPAEVTLLQGDSSKAVKELGWSYEFSLQSLIEEMVENDLRILRNKM